MPSFTVRIELHKAIDIDYERLHAAMSKEKFTRTIIADDGNEYKLPTAEYDKAGDYNRKEVFDSAERAVQTLGKGYWILVTQSNGRTFKLEKVIK